MAEKELISEGKCIFCDEIILQEEIKKHLAKHLSEKEKADVNNKPETYCHIAINNGKYFLHFLVYEKTRLYTIDNFLRAIWLECCDHLSAFYIRYRANVTEFKMDEKIIKVFITPKKEIFYDYDFGSTTRLVLKDIKHYKLNLKEEILLLSRNEPLKFMCTICKKEPAVNICSVCDYDAFCEKCSELHEEECEDFADYSNYPVVNSPRMGECGYTGGSIDLERDGIYKIK